MYPYSDYLSIYLFIYIYIFLSIFWGSWPEFFQELIGLSENSACYVTFSVISKLSP